MRRNRQNGRTRRSESMQLTPMIDVMTTLLAVFMLTAPLMTSGIDLDLPKAGKSVSSGTDYTVVLSVNRVGQYFVGEERMALAAAIRRVSAMRTENSKLQVMIAGDTRSDYGAVMRAMGALKDAGFDAVSLQTSNALDDK